MREINRKIEQLLQESSELSAEVKLIIKNLEEAFALYSLDNIEEDGKFAKTGNG